MPEIFITNSGDLKRMTLEQLKTFREILNVAISQKEGKAVTNSSKEPSRADFEASGAHYTSEQIMDAMHQVTNGPLWEKAKKLSQKEYGEIRWPFVTYVYEKMGGQK